MCYPWSIARGKRYGSPFYARLRARARRQCHAGRVPVSLSARPGALSARPDHLPRPLDACRWRPCDPPAQRLHALVHRAGRTLLSGGESSARLGDRAEQHSLRRDSADRLDSVPEPARRRPQPRPVCARLAAIGQSRLLRLLAGNLLPNSWSSTSTSSAAALPPLRLHRLRRSHGQRTRQWIRRSAWLASRASAALAQHAYLTNHTNLTWVPVVS